MKQKKIMIVSASVVTYNTNWIELQECIETLQNNGVSLIYVSDNSEKDTLKNLCLTKKNVIYIFNNKNLGYGAGHNVAIKKALQMSSDYHLVVNSDVSFGNDVIRRITRYMDDNLDVAQLQPKIVYPNGKLQLTVRLLPTPANLMSRRFLPLRLSSWLNEKYTLSFWRHDAPANIPYHQGSFMFFRTSSFEKVGLFDERFFMYPEDIDITRRMHRRYRTMYWPMVTVVHKHNAASYHSIKMLFIHVINIIRYFNKWGWLLDRERKLWNKKVLDELKQKELITH